MICPINLFSGFVTRCATWLASRTNCIPAATLNLISALKQSQNSFTSAQKTRTVVCDNILAVYSALMSSAETEPNNCRPESCCLEELYPSLKLLKTCRYHRQTMQLVPRSNL